jgi:hypothetical protein
LWILGLIFGETWLRSSRSKDLQRVVFTIRSLRIYGAQTFVCIDVIVTTRTLGLALVGPIRSKKGKEVLYGKATAKPSATARPSPPAGVNAAGVIPGSLPADVVESPIIAP